MFRSFISGILLLFISTFGYGQTRSGSDTGPEPTGGANKLTLTFYKIDFTREQRKQLDGVVVELIFSIDKSGIPTLEKVNGTKDDAILDSLQRTARLLPPFTPGTVNGVKESTLYFIQLQFPKYRLASVPVNPTGFSYKEYKLDDFEYITKSGSRLDMAFGGIFNGFAGSAGNYLAPGGGVKIDMLFTGKKGFGGGLMMNFYGNKLKKNYPITSGREQNSAPPTLLTGLSLNKYVRQQARRELMIQLDLSAVIQNITPRLSNHDEEYTQLGGFSPGLAVNYLMAMGKGKPNYYYGSPILLQNYINVHGAVRPLFMDLKQASGVMLEVGVSYRMGMLLVSEYKIKPEAVK